jgi:hypothetical protein
MARSHRWDGVTPEQRLRAKCGANENGCWIWSRAFNGAGYPSTMWLNGKVVLAHRASYLIFKGPIPDGLEIDHLCRDKRCVNPEHLEAVTRQTNLLRGTGFAARHARQTHCKRGHEFTDANTYISARGERVCRTCRAAREWGRRHGLTIEEALTVRVHTNIDDVARHMALIEAGAE